MKSGKMGSFTQLKLKGFMNEEDASNMKSDLVTDVDSQFKDGDDMHAMLYTVQHQSIRRKDRNVNFMHFPQISFVCP
jgi:hypothetical protein